MTNWRAGLFRVWIVLSTLWVAALLIFSVPTYWRAPVFYKYVHTLPPEERHGDPSYLYDMVLEVSPADPWFKYAVLYLGVPLSAFLIGYMADWALRGFKIRPTR